MASSLVVVCDQYSCALAVSPRGIRTPHRRGVEGLPRDSDEINLIAAAGDSPNAFDVTLAAMVSGIEYICGARHEGSRPRDGLHVLPDKPSQAVAETQQRLQRPF